VGILGVLGHSGDWFADTDYSQIRASVKRALADPSVKTVDLVIDSPGGSVLGLPETADVIHAANRVKPVRAFVTGIAASAAYWLASQASSITLTPSGEVGSVGVLDIHADISKALENSGVKLTAVTAGEHKVERAPFTPLSDDAKAHMQAASMRGTGSFSQPFGAGVERVCLLAATTAEAGCSAHVRPYPLEWWTSFQVCKAGARLWGGPRLGNFKKEGL
jgi:ClpP class serine protease